MTPSKLIEILMDAIKHKEQLLIVGQPGIGKTDIVRQACEALKADVIVSHPAVSDPTDYKGLPVRSEDKTHAEFIPFGETWKAINAKKPTVWFVDDLGQSSEAVQKALMQLLLGRRLNGHMLSDEIVFVGATNDVGQRAGVTGLLEPVKSRWDSIVQLDVSLEDWCNWAFQNSMPAELIAFLRTRPELLCAFEPTKAIVNHPSPRTWASVGRRLNRHIKDFDLITGAVGKGAATELLAFLELANEAPSLDEIIKNPTTTKIPEKPALRYLVSTGLAHRADKKNFDNIIKYLDRMSQPFRVLCMRDAIQKNPDLQECPLFVKWVLGEGKDIANEK
jgi:hypothetical protein